MRWFVEGRGGFWLNASMVLALAGMFVAVIASAITDSQTVAMIAVAATVGPFFALGMAFLALGYAELLRESWESTKGDRDER